MLGIINLIISGPASNRYDDDFADRLSNRYTVLILVVFTVSLSAQLYIGSPITCWAPKEFQDSWIKYTTSLCWVKNTYYLPLHEKIPRDTQERKDREIHYYQWLPFVLLFQAVFFYLPSVLWNSFNQKAGMDCDSILATANKYHRSEQDASGRLGLQLQIANQLDRFLRVPTNSEVLSPYSLRRILCCSMELVRGYYLCILYIITKIFYLGNVIAQFLFLDFILNTDFSMYGYEILKSASKIVDAHSEVFPRVTMCDIQIRQLGNIHKYTLQCMLPINMYAEKIFAFLWLWMLLVGVATGVSILLWLFRFTISTDKYQYIENHLRSSTSLVLPESFSDIKRQKGALVEFVDYYLCMDGMFVLQLIGHNTNNLTVSDTIRVVWDKWVLREKVKIHESRIVSTHV